MKLSKLTVCNFKGVQFYQDLTPTQLTAFIGANGTGKTSILDAIRFLFTGKSPSNYVTKGEAEGYVEGEIEGVGLVKRGNKNGVSYCYVDGKSCTQKALAEQIEKTFEMSVTTSSIATSSDVLREMFGGDFSKYLLSEGYMSMEISDDDFFELCSFSEFAESIVREELMGATTVSVDDINNLYASFKVSLKTQKKDQATLEAQVKGAVMDAPAFTEKDVTEAVQETQKQLVAAKAAIDTYKKQEAEYKKRIQSVAEIEKRINAISTQPVNIALRQEKEKAVSDKRVQYTQLLNSASTMQKDVQSFRELIEKLNTPVCPISGKLVCTTDKTPVQAELAEKINSLNAEIRKLLAAKEVLCKEGKDTAQEVQVMLQNEKLAAEKDRLLAQKAGLSENLTKPKPVVDETEKAQAAYDKAVEKKEAIAAYKRYLNAKKRFEDGELLREAYKQIVATLEPKGKVAQTILSKAVDPLQDYCNEVAGVLFNDKEVYFDVSNGMKVCLKSNETIIPFDSCSSGEQFRLLLIIMDMINQLSGYNVLVLDNLDMLDADALSKVITYLPSCTYDHAFIASVNNVEMIEVLTANKVNFKVL